jgi:SAM-dependent methyltransferase
MTYGGPVSDDWLASGTGTADEARQYYDELALQYDATLDEWGYDAPSVAVGLLRSALGDRWATADVLDAGCGTGLVGAALRVAGFGGSLTGIDLSPVSVERARLRGGYADVQIGDLRRPLPYGDDRFDGLTCVGVLTYVPDIEAIWREFCRVVRPGGCVVLTQRDDLWHARRCTAVLDLLERDGRWAVTHLSPPSAYLPDNAEFSDRILVRYLRAGVR